MVVMLGSGNTDNLFLFYAHLNLPCQPKFPTNYLIYADGWVGVVLLITGFNLTRMFNLSHRICKCTFYLAYYVCNVIQDNAGIPGEGKETL